MHFLHAFTLVELLTVLALAATLAALTLGAMRGVRERAAIARTRAELSVFAQALEAYRRHYGDYPQTGAMPQAAPTPSGVVPAGSAEAQLFNALAGKLGPALAPLTGKIFVEPGRFTLETADLPVPGETPAVANCLLDPWGRRYLYFYRGADGSGVWTAAGYVLYSAGPDGNHDAPAADGSCDTTTVNNADNLYANR